MKTIACIGAIYLDINVPNFPLPHPMEKLIGTETLGENYEMLLGGSAVNFARFCKELGLKTLFIGKTGKDIAKSIIIEKFIEEGIIPVLSEDSTRQTNMNTNLILPSSESIMLSFGNANQSLNFENISQQLREHSQDIDMLYLGGAFKLKMLLSSLKDVVGAAKSQGKKVILDHGRVVNTVTEEERQIMKEVVLLADVYLPSKDEFLDLWNVGTVEEGLRLFPAGQVVVVKDAENGAYAFENGEVLHIPAFIVNAINSIGAGDSFNAGFIAAQSQGKSLRESIHYANAVAALEISQDNFPSKDEINTLLVL